MRSVHAQQPHCPVLAEVEDISEDVTTDDSGDAEESESDVPEERHESDLEDEKVCSTK